MSLDEHYLFSEPFPSRMGNVDQTVAAEEVASGVLVVIHLLAGGNCPANQEQLTIARGLAPASVRYLREIGEHRGTPFVVTEPLPGNASFRSWLGQVTGLPMNVPDPEPRPLVASEPDVNRFKKQVWKVPSVPPSLDQAKPGEFTQLLRAPGAPATPAPTPAPLSPTPAPPPAHAGPGEFTQLMQAQGFAKSQPPSPPPAAPTPVGPPSSGEFTQLLQAASVGTGIRPAAASPGPPPPQAQPAPDADEFARMLQGTPSSSERTATSPVPIPLQPAPPSAAPPADYDKTRLFTAPASPPPAPPRAPAPLDFGAAQAPAARPTRPESPLTSAQPGEFTRMLQSPMAPTPQAPLFSGTGEPAAEKAPGGFTQLFESPFASPQSAPSPPPVAPSYSAPSPTPQTAQPLYPVKPTASDQNEFDRLFNEPNAPPVRGNVTNLYSTPQSGPPAPAVQQGPSEYTLMFKAPAQAASPATPPAPAPQAKSAAPAPAPKPPGNYMTLIYVLGGLLVVAIVLVAYLLVTK